MREWINNSNYKHWMKWTRIFNIWCSLRNRCDKKYNLDYKRYGWRWITYCEKWKTFLGFYEDMKEWYANNLEIDRINNDWNYTKDNCRWATRKQQNRNSSNNRIYKWKCISEWCEELWLNYSTVRSRINQSKWTIEKALELV